jgi:hypothetical protein
MEERDEQAGVNRQHRDDGAPAVAIVDVGSIHCRHSTRRMRGRCESATNAPGVTGKGPRFPVWNRAAKANNNEG